MACRLLLPGEAVRVTGPPWAVLAPQRLLPPPPYKVGCLCPPVCVDGQCSHHPRARGIAEAGRFLSHQACVTVHTIPHARWSDVRPEGVCVLGADPPEPSHSPRQPA